MRWRDAEKIIQMAVAPYEKALCCNCCRGEGRGRPTGFHERGKRKTVEQPG